MNLSAGRIAGATSHLSEVLTGRTRDLHASVVIVDGRSTPRRLA